LLAQGRWFSPGTPASSTTKTGRHDIAEILLKVALSTINKSINQSIYLNKFVTALCLLQSIFKFTAILVVGSKDYSVTKHQLCEYKLIVYENIPIRKHMQQYNKFPN